jgi:carboxyl-terminal processing protease
MHARNTVSLNIDKRRAERKDLEERQLADINAWRQIKGKKPVKSLEALPDDADRPDVLLREAAQIATDMSKMNLGIGPQPETKVAKKVAAGF